MRVIGITGTLGAGKGAVVDYLRQQHNFQWFSVRDFLLTEISRRGLPPDRDSMRNVANELRAQNSPSYIVEQLFSNAQQSGADCIIESVRTPGEVDALAAKPDFVLLAVDADMRMRYERVVVRGSETDQVDFETWKAQEESEMHNTDPNKQNLAECIRRANIKLENNGTLDELHEQVRLQLQL